MFPMSCGEASLSAGARSKVRVQTNMGDDAFREPLIELGILIRLNWNMPAFLIPDTLGIIYI